MWDVRLGAFQSLSGAGVAGSALSQNWVLTGVSDVMGNMGTVTVAANSLTALAAQVLAKQNHTWQVGVADVQNEGTLLQGCATPGESLKLNWGGQFTPAFSADAQCYWS